MRICVCTHQSPRGGEIPAAFHLGGKRLHVVAVLDRWTDSLHRYFEVGVDDGRRFVLRFDPEIHSWELAAVFAATAAKPPKRVNPAAPRKFFSALPKQSTPADAA